MKITALMFGLVFSLTVVGFAQTRTVTNATLSKFTEKRLAAERDYRDNYQRMGFPSPEDEGPARARRAASWCPARKRADRA